MKCVKRQKDLTLKDEPPGQKVSRMLLGKRGGQLLIAPDGMMQLVQSGNYSVVDVSGDESLSLML